MLAKFRQGFAWLLAALLLVALVLATAQPVDYLIMRHWFIPIVMVLVVALSLLIIVKIQQLFKKMNAKQRRIYWIVLIALIVIAQLFVLFNFVPYGEADSFFVRKQALALAEGSRHWNNYFYTYTNNLNYTIFDSWLIKLGRCFGMKYPWIFINFLQFVWVDLGLWASAVILKYWQKPIAKLWLPFIWLIYIPIYCYGIVNYTDVWILPIPMMVMACELNWRHQTGKKQILPALGIILGITFALMMKANMIVLAIALIMSLCFDPIKAKKSWLKVLGLVIPLLLAIIISVPVGHHLAYHYGFNKDNKQELPATSWIYMSLNPQTNGLYNSSDAYTQMNLKSVQARKEFEKVGIKQRIKQKGIRGMSALWRRKARVFLANGDVDCMRLTSQWQKVPHWFIAHINGIQFWIGNSLQFLYLTSLVGALLLFIPQQNKKKNWHFLTLGLFIIGLSIFHIIFWEVEERYALPIMIPIMLFGMSGWSRLPVLTFSRHFQKLGSIVVIPVLLGVIYYGEVNQLTRPSTQYSNTNIQSRGLYYEPFAIKLKPGQTITTKIKVPSRSVQLNLIPVNAQQYELYQLTKKPMDWTTPATYTGGLVNVNVSYHNKTIAQLNNVNPVTTENITFNKYINNGIIKVSIKNVGFEDVYYGVGKSNYPLAYAPIDGYQHTYLRFQVRNIYTGSVISSAMLKLFTLLYAVLAYVILWTSGFKPDTKLKQLTNINWQTTKD